jgi:hypothetical protein
VDALANLVHLHSEQCVRGWKHDGCTINVMRGDRFERKFRVGPNTVNAMHDDGSIDASCTTC